MYYVHNVQIVGLVVYGLVYGTDGSVKLYSPGWWSGSPVTRAGKKVKYAGVKKSRPCLWTVLVGKCVCIFPCQTVLFLPCALCPLTPEHIKAVNTFFN